MGYYMKIKFSITYLIIANAILILFYINKNSSSISVSYTKQALEQEVELLTKKKETLTHRLSAFHTNKSSIIECTQTKLGLEKIKLTQIKKIDSDEHSNKSTI